MYQSSKSLWMFWLDEFQDRPEGADEVQDRPEGALPRQGSLI